MKKINRFEKFLIIRPDRLGDLVLSLPVAQGIKSKFPNSTISYFISNSYSDIRYLAPYVDKWIIDKNNAGGRLSISQLTANIKISNFDWSIELLPAWRTSIAAFFARIPNRIGTSRRIYSLFYNRKVSLRRRNSNIHQSDLDLTLLTPLNILDSGLLPELKITDNAIIKAKKLIGEMNNNFIIIHPGSGGSAPNWPLENYRKLSYMLTKKTEKRAIITGNNENIGAFDECINLNGKTDLETLAGLINLSSLFISGSTGPLHLADALGVKCMAFYPNRLNLDKFRWGPKRNLANVLSPSSPCKCRDLSKCNCLNAITVEEAFEMAQKLMAIKPGKDVELS